MLYTISMLICNMNNIEVFTRSIVECYLHLIRGVKLKAMQKPVIIVYKITDALLKSNFKIIAMLIKFPINNPVSEPTLSS